MSDHLRGYGWRHATWCRWEKAEGTCDCGLREHQDAASPPAADPLDVDLVEQTFKNIGLWMDYPRWTTVRRDNAEKFAAEYARLAREEEQR